MSKLGAHVSSGPRTGFVDQFLKPCADISSPVAVVVALDQNVAVTLLDYSPSTRLVFRTQINSQDFPQDIYTDPTGAAQRWMSACLPVWNMNPANFYSPINEPNPATLSQWASLGIFLSACIDLSGGLKLCLGNLSTGTPADSSPEEPTSLESKLGAMGLNFWHKVQAGGHVWGVHEYPFGADYLKDTTPYHALRYQRTRDYLKVQGIDIHFIVTELGPGIGNFNINCLADLAWYDAQIMADPSVIGAALYQVGGAENISPYFNNIATYIMSHPTPDLNPDPTPAPGRGAPRLQYARTVYVTEDAQWFNQQAVFDRMRTDGVGEYSSSLDSAMLGDLDKRKVLVFDTGDQSRRTAITAFRDQYYPGVDLSFRYIPAVVSPAVNVPYLSQLDPVTAKYAPGDCGPADIAMLLNFFGVKVTVDDVSKATGKPPGFLLTSLQELIDVAAKFGLTLYSKPNATMGEVVDEVNNQHHPVISLISYAQLPVWHKYDPNYNAGHFIVLTGANDTWLTYNDPYWPDTRGANRGLRWSIFDPAWTTPAPGNTTSRVLLKVKSFVAPIVTPPPSSSIYQYIGVGAGNPSQITQAELNAFEQSKVKAIKLLTVGDPTTDTANFNMIRSYNPNAFIMARMFFSVNPPSPFSPQQFVDFTANGLKTLYSLGVRHFEIHNEPNLFNEGLGFSWLDGTGFATWLLAVLNILKPKYPDAKWGFPGLSPQPNLPLFLTNAATAIQACDWVGAHAYWNDSQFPMLDVSGGLNFRNVRDKSLGKPVIITEFSNNNKDISATQKGQEYAQYFAALKSEPGVLGAFAFALSWPGSDTNHEGWAENVGIPQALGAATP